jgi:hypothetical protein
MSKAKDKDNILTDLYNLKLTENPEQDKAMIIEFFKKYDPNLTKYLTAKDTEGITDFLEMSGSLGVFEKIIGKSWFETEDTKDFYDLWKFAKEIIDTYLNDKPITQWQLILVEMLLKDVKPSFLIGNKETRVVTNVGWIPKEIDPKKYKFMQGTNFNLSKLSANQETQSGEFILSLSMLKYDLFKAILPFLNGEIVIRKCLAEDCQRAFIPTTLKQVYHSNICRARIGKRRERSKQDYVNVN